MIHVLPVLDYGREAWGYRNSMKFTVIIETSGWPITFISSPPTSL